MAELIKFLVASYFCPKKDKTKKALRVPSPCNEDNHLTFEGRRLVVSDIQYVNKKNGYHQFYHK